jgi:hypothetical protein
VDALLRRLLRAGLRRGLAGNWTWFVVAGCAFILRRALSDTGGVVSTLRVNPGERLLITVRDPNAPVDSAEGSVTTTDDA